jgi:hypothetical protein
MGTWAGEPVRYAYQWVRDGNTNIGTGASLLVTPDMVGETVACVVSATNAHGTTVAPASNPVVVEEVVAVVEAPPSNEEPVTTS